MRHNIICNYSEPCRFKESRLFKYLSLYQAGLKQSDSFYKNGGKDEYEAGKRCDPE